MLKSWAISFLAAVLSACTSQPKTLIMPRLFSDAEAIALNESDSFVDVGGFRLHIYCVGNGSPTVILDAGLNQPGYSWVLVQREVAKFTRVCSYDRAGHGLSEPGPSPRTSKRVAEELHVLLRAAQVHGPYLLVGHSFGGINLRTFEALYPHEVVGLVMVDASTEDQSSRMAVVTFPEPPISDRILHFFKENFDFIRHYADSKNFGSWPKEPLFSDEQWQYYIELMTSTHHLDSIEEEGASIGVSQAELKAMKRDLGDKPLIVITKGKFEDTSQDAVELQRAHREMDKIWNELQLDLTRLSSNSRHLIAKDSGHMIPLGQPQIIVDAIREMCEALRESKPL